MVGASVLELRRGDVDDAFARAVRDQVHETEQILAGIPKAHAAANAGLIVGGRAAHVERHHALVLIPDIDHSVDLLVGGFDDIAAKQVFPVVIQLRKCPLDSGVGVVLCDHRVRRFLVHHVRCLEFLLDRVLQIAQKKYIRFLLAGRECDVDLVRGDRGPAACHRVCTFAGQNSLRLVRAVVSADKVVADRVKAVNVRVYRIDCIVVSALAVLCLVVDGRADHFHFAGAQIPLEISGVVIGVPQAPFHIGEERDLLFRSGVIPDLHM